MQRDDEKDAQVKYAGDRFFNLMYRSVVGLSMLCGY